MNDTVNIDTLLPVGERLKPLLSKSRISESDMKIFLLKGEYILAIVIRNYLFRF